MYMWVDGLMLVRIFFSQRLRAAWSRAACVVSPETLVLFGDRDINHTTGSRSGEGGKKPEHWARPLCLV